MPANPLVLVVLNFLLAQSLQFQVPDSPATTVITLNPGLFFASRLRTGIPADEMEAMQKEEELTSRLTKGADSSFTLSLGHWMTMNSFAESTYRCLSRRGE